VRHMFYRPEDIQYFKAVELRTRSGLRGHIRDSRGTKGYMKCLFSDFIRSDDAVWMYLYKRQYPPFEASHFETPH